MKIHVLIKNQKYQNRQNTKINKNIISMDKKNSSSWDNLEAREERSLCM